MTFLSAIPQSCVFSLSGCTDHFELSNFFRNLRPFINFLLEKTSQPAEHWASMLLTLAFLWLTLLKMCVKTFATTFHWKRPLERVLQRPAY